MIGTGWRASPLLILQREADQEPIEGFAPAFESIHIVGALQFRYTKRCHFVRALSKTPGSLRSLPSLGAGFVRAANAT
jgi:hypothetical protein